MRAEPARPIQNCRRFRGGIRGEKVIGDFTQRVFCASVLERRMAIFPKLGRFGAARRLDAGEYLRLVRKS